MTERCLRLVAIEIVAFVPAASIDPVRLSGDSYFLQYDGQVAAQPYALIAKALARNTKVAVAKLAWHGRERLVLLRVRDGALIAHVLKWDDEIRDPAKLAPKAVKVTDSEIDAAVHLVESMTTDDISGYRDTYREALEAVIEAKAEGRRPPEPRTADEEQGGRVVDLMAALQESVRKAQSARGENSGDAIPRDARVQAEAEEEDRAEGLRKEGGEEDRGREEASPAPWCLTRATVHRATTVLAEWNTHVPHPVRRTPTERTRDDTIAALHTQLAQARRQARELQGQLDALATVTAHLYAENLTLCRRLSRPTTATPLSDDTPSHRDWNGVDEGADYSSQRRGRVPPFR